MPPKSESPVAAKQSKGSRLGLGELGDFVGFRLRRVQNQLSRDFTAATAALGLRSGQFSSLAIIAANPGVSQSELAREVGLDKSVIVAIVDELEKSGSAERKRSPQDRRRHALFITPAGEAHLAELFRIVAKTEEAVLHQLSGKEMRVLSELLDRMYAVCVRDDS